MGLVVYWYDFVCFGIVGVAFIGSLYVLWKREGGGKGDIERSMYESLLIGRPAESNATNYPRPRGHVSSSQLWTSCWRGLHPLWLLGLRFVSCVVLAGFLAADIITYDTTIFVYYTEWTFALVIIYFAIGTVVSAHGCVLYYYSRKPPSDNGERGEFLKMDVGESISTNAATSRGKNFRGSIKLQSHYYDEEEMRQRAGFWGYLMQTAYQLMGCMHTLNAVFLLLDTSVNSLPFPWFRLSYFVLWSCCYVIFQWVIHACGFPWWPYPFLELSTSWAPVWYLCLAVVHIPCYGLYSLLARAKNSIFSRLFPHAFVRSY
ncbi:uncharacterized protein LOC132306067 isoform X2 [Cornus florida]|uniref:uncharacterized protein LOC132306067 isoform X2 n=1 Tax=Cornus florida TaxID=4283 RepID=UPI0028A035B8|nr:uncharacterized protein LOC132306067 isoform X2 [Cornus florida]